MNYYDQGVIVRIKELKKPVVQEQELLEINMSPTNLKRLVRDIPGALAGMEFEMIVPNTADPDDYEPEPDYEQDARSRSFDDIRDFFYDGEYNSSRAVDRALDDLRQEFYESLDETIDEEFRANAFDIVREYIENNVNDDYIMGINGLDLSAEDQERFQEDRDFRRKAISDYTEQAIENETSDYEDAQQEFRDDRFSEADEGRWLAREYPYMSDVQNNTNLSWPYYTEPEGGDVSIEEIADDFQDMIGKPVNHSSNYHGAKRAPGTYVVEPDGSLEADNPRDSGLEFVSPPMPLDELLVDLEKVKKWADRIGAYTNNSTGLHINVSVPDMSTAKLDYVKLALLLGDERVLNEFGRISNNYTKSAMKIVRDRIRDNPAQAQEILDKMRDHLGALATKLIHSGETNKYTSINTKDNYVEFRSPGGDWLDTNYELIVPSAMRFVVALDAAMNPDKYRQEYLKKLYKALAPSGDEDPIAHFARYVAGEVPKQALKSFVRQVQSKRQAARNATRGQKYWWEVKRPGYFASIEVVASSKEEALAKAVEPGNYPDWASATNLQATPIKPYKETPADQSEPTEIGGSIKYEIFRRADDSIVRQFWSADDDMARSMAVAWFEEQGSDRRGYGLRRVSARLGTDRANTRTQEPADDSPERSYEIYNKQTGAVVGEPFMLRNDQQALTRLTDYQHFGRHGLDRDTAEATFGVRVTNPNRPAAPAPTGEFTGTWLIQDPQGNTIHRFSGIGNVQSDANRHAIAWLRDNPQHIYTGVEVVPEMR